MARHRVPVLITGASGVGKEYAARYLHRCRNAREPAPFLGLNCAAVPEDLIEAELFGAERGAFTGAVGMRVGLFEQAGSGTLFLDEVGDMPLAMQAKLLRAVQEHSVRRIGGDPGHRHPGATGLGDQLRPGAARRPGALSRGPVLPHEHGPCGVATLA